MILVFFFFHALELILWQSCKHLVTKESQTQFSFFSSFSFSLSGFPHAFTQKRNSGSRMQAPAILHSSCVHTSQNQVNNQPFFFCPPIQELFEKTKIETLYFFKSAFLLLKALKLNSRSAPLMRNWLCSLNFCQFLFLSRDTIQNSTDSCDTGKAVDGLMVSVDVRDRDWEKLKDGLSQYIWALEQARLIGTRKHSQRCLGRALTAAPGTVQRRGAGCHSVSRCAPSSPRLFRLRTRCSLPETLLRRVSLDVFSEKNWQPTHCVLNAIASPLWRMFAWRWHFSFGCDVRGANRRLDFARTNAPIERTDTVARRTRTLSVHDRFAERSSVSRWYYLF